MLADIVIDTNVLMHCADPREGRQQESIELLRCVLDSEILLCVDDGFDLDSARNLSFIGHEYIKHLRFGTFGFNLVLEMAKRQRMRFLAKRPADVAVARKINSLIKKPFDRAFLGVAFNSESSILASHDHEDYPIPKRVRIRAELGVEVVEAGECKGRI